MINSISSYSSLLKHFSFAKNVVVLLINFIITYSGLLNYCIFAHPLLIEDREQGEVRKELIIAPLTEWFQTASLNMLY